MNAATRPWAPCALLATLAACATAPATGGELTVSTFEARGTADGGDAHFTGRATIGMLFVPNGPRTFSGATVDFAPGARTNWHTHPAGQTLVVTEGTGWVQAEGGERRTLRPGDVVWTPPDVRHWHGATATTAMSHIALQTAVDGQAVKWLGSVDEATYTGTR